jgi:hypothetical protein
LSLEQVSDFRSVPFHPPSKTTVHTGFGQVRSEGYRVLGYVELAASTSMYGMGIVAQSVAARRVERPEVGLGLLALLVRDRLYLVGFAGQVGGFVLAFLARASLPLYLVQAGSSCAIGLATVVGVVVLGWRVRSAEVVMLVVMAAGLVLLAAAATPSTAGDIPPAIELVLFALPLLAGPAATLASRRKAALTLAMLAGTQFAVVAVCGRAIADSALLDLLLEPLAWLLFLSALLGQVCMSAALARGTATSTVGSMDAVSMVITSVVGIAVLGDQVVPGREWSVVLGIALVLSAVLVLAPAASPVRPVRPVRETV